ncbi:hypothetical protein V8E53_007555 [Lactarius tabidus]
MPLHLASFTRRAETVRLLIQHGQIHSKPLHLAVSSRFASDGNINIVHELLGHGANVDDRTVESSESMGIFERFKLAPVGAIRAKAVIGPEPWHWLNSRLGVTSGPSEVDPRLCGRPVDNIVWRVGSAFSLVPPLAFV